uniref:Small ribosomal subunit protein uS13m n=1 Tax=Gonatozygon brebissonii TaxID=184482 RepID=A0A6G9IF47_9VIRI|nr:ribosomal protein S13 [Gonatozygon brebissonii]QIQ23080.1 ribosomal protein S13 [Gonatozygon brebissonii]
MSYILGTNLNPSKKVRVALTQIFGIGPNKSLQVCDNLGISDTYFVAQLTKTQIDQMIKRMALQFLIDSELRRIIQKDIKRLIHIGCYRGFRHTEGLPLRGQRTHTNAKTSRKLKISLSSKRIRHMVPL